VIFPLRDGVIFPLRDGVIFPLRDGVIFPLRGVMLPANVIDEMLITSNAAQIEGFK
jgi:hypothetical protein